MCCQNEIDSKLKQQWRCIWPLRIGDFSKWWMNRYFLIHEFIWLVSSRLKVITWINRIPFEVNWTFNNIYFIRFYFILYDYYALYTLDTFRNKFSLNLLETLADLRTSCEQWAVHWTKWSDKLNAKMAYIYPFQCKLTSILSFATQNSHCISTHGSWLVHKCLIWGWEKSQLESDETRKYCIYTTTKSNKKKQHEKM